jgi:hypothetical protein
MIKFRSRIGFGFGFGFGFRLGLQVPEAARVRV